MKKLNIDYKQNREKTLNKKKNTKQWCKGKVGKEHVPKCVVYDKFWRSKESKEKYPQPTWYELICEVCAKRLDHYYPFKFQVDNPNYPKPDWVKEEE